MKNFKINFNENIFPLNLMKRYVEFTSNPNRTINNSLYLASKVIRKEKFGHGHQRLVCICLTRTLWVPERHGNICILPENIVFLSLLRSNPLFPTTSARCLPSRWTLLLIRSVGGWVTLVSLLQSTLMQAVQFRSNKRCIFAQIFGNRQTVDHFFEVREMRVDLIGKHLKSVYTRTNEVDHQSTMSGSFKLFPWSHTLIEFVSSLC